MGECDVTADSKKQSLPWEDKENTKIPTLIDSYKVIAKLGQGGFGTVYEVQDTRRQGEFKEALKVLETAEKDERFDEEIEVLNSMNIPGVVKVHDFGSYQGCAYYVMESISRPQTIIDYCLKKQLSLENTLDLFIRTFEILQSVHDKDIIHRDLKPDNILVDAAGRPYIIDFGIAKSTTYDDDIERTGDKFIGTPLYASPQHLVDAANVSPLFDLYSLNIVFYMCLCRGMHPKPFVHKPNAYGFEVNTKAIKPEDRFRLFLREGPVPITQRNPILPAALKDYFAQNLCLDDSGRQKSAAVIIDSLRELRKDADENKLVLMDCQNEVLINPPQGYTCLNRDSLQGSVLNLDHIHTVITDNNDDYPGKKIIYCGSGDSAFAHHSFSPSAPQLSDKIRNLLIYLSCQHTSAKSVYDGQPYKSLLSYEITDENIFFGRTKEIFELQQLSKENDFLCILGESGIGKSSLIQAGLLNQQACSQVLKGNISKSCDDVWAQLSIKQGWDLPVKPSSEEFLNSDFEFIVDEDLVVFFDQFEVLLSKVPERQALLNIFHFLKSAGIKTIIAVRSDSFALYKEFIHELEWTASEYTLYKPDREALMEIITAPAIMAGKAFAFDQSSGLPLNEFILNQVIEQTISLPILSFSLDAVFNNSPDDMSAEVFRELGEFSGIISNRAEEILNSLCLSEDDTQQTLGIIFQKLIALDCDTEKPCRKMALLSDFPNTSPAAKMIHLLQESHLIRFSADTKQKYVLFSHDSLINPQLDCWHRISQWIHEQKDSLLCYDDFCRAYKKHQSSPKVYLNAVELSRVSTLLKNNWNLSDTERAFYKSSLKRLRTKNFLKSATAVAIGILLFFIFTYQETIAAQNRNLISISQEKEKIEQHISLKNSQLQNLKLQEQKLSANIKESEQLLDLAKVDNQIAVARDLVNRQGAYNSVVAELAKVPVNKRDWFWSFLLGKVMDFRHITLADHSAEVLNGDFSKDGKYFASCSVDGTVALYKTKNWQKQSSYDLKKYEESADSVVDEVQFTPDSKFILAGTGGKLRLLSIKDAKVLQELKAGADILRLKFSLDGKFMAASCANGLILLYQYEKGALTKLDEAFHKEGTAVQALAFGKENRLMTGGFDNSVSYWDCSKKKLQRTYNSADLNKPTHRGDILDCVYLEDQDIFFTVAKDKNYCQWNARDPQKLSWKLTASSHNEGITSAISTSLNGKNIFISASSDRQILFREINPLDESILSTSDLSSISNINANGLNSLDRSADGKYLAISSDDGTVSILNIQRALQREVDGSSYNLKIRDRIIDLLPAENNSMYIITRDKLLHWRPLQNKPPSVLLELPVVAGQYFKAVKGQQTLYIASDDGQILAVDLQSKKQQLYRAATATMTDMRYATDKLLCLFDNGEVTLGPINSLKTLKAPAADSFTSIDFYDQSAIYLGTQQGAIYKFNKGELSRLKNNLTTKITHLEASPDHIITCVDNSTVHINSSEQNYSIDNLSFGKFLDFRAINTHYAISNSSLDNSSAIWRLRNGTRVDQAGIEAGGVLQTLSCNIAETEYLVLRGRKNLVDNDSRIQQQSVIKLMPIIDWQDRGNEQRPLQKVHQLIKNFVLDYGF